MFALLQGCAGMIARMAVFSIAAALCGAQSTQPPAPRQPPARPQRPPAFPQHAQADPAVIARGRALYGVNCNFCHGSDARGGEGGPNLLRSEIVLNDRTGEGIAPVVQNGRGDMPKINLLKEQIADVAAFIHSFQIGGYDISRLTPPSILVGDAKAGEAAFRVRCASCHSPTGDLKGIATKITDPKILQNTWLMPAGGGRGGNAPPIKVSPVTVAVTLPSGQKTEGRLIRIDDFLVTLTDSEGVERSFRRDGDAPMVELRDPMTAHRELLPKYTDQEIHDLTSFLVTLK